MNVTRKKAQGGYDYYIRCEYCGEDITETSVEFGMDCKNHCSEKKWKEMLADGKVPEMVLEMIETVTKARKEMFKMRCNKCHRPMLGTIAYDGDCGCGGLIERNPDAC
jgi:hypothetical protein